MLRLRRVDTAVHPPSDETLMLAYAGGDGVAFAELYERHRARLFHYLLGQLRDRPLAEELFQDIWQRVVHARAGWKPEAAFATWLFRIARNQALDRLRRARHVEFVALDDALHQQVPADTPTPEAMLHLLELLGGWPAAWLAQRVLRHKSRKERYQLAFLAAALFNLAAIALLLIRNAVAG